MGFTTPRSVTLLRRQNEQSLEVTGHSFDADVSVNGKPAEGRCLASCSRACFKARTYPSTAPAPHPPPLHFPFHPFLGWNSGCNGVAKHALTARARQLEFRFSLACVLFAGTMVMLELQQMISCGVKKLKFRAKGISAVAIPGNGDIRE